MMGLLEDMDARLKRLEEALGVGAPLGNYIDQKKSVLGPKKHCAAVRRRVLEGDERAIITGRRFLLSPEAHMEEARLDSSAALTLPHPADNDDFYRDLMNKVGAGVEDGSYPRDKQRGSRSCRHQGISPGGDAAEVDEANTGEGAQGAHQRARRNPS